MKMWNQYIVIVDFHQFQQALLHYSNLASVSTHARREGEPGKLITCVTSGGTGIHIWNMAQQWVEARDAVSSSCFEWQSAVNQQPETFQHLRCHSKLQLHDKSMNSIPRLGYVHDRLACGSCNTQRSACRTSACWFVANCNVQIERSNVDDNSSLPTYHCAKFGRWFHLMSITW